MYMIEINYPTYKTLIFRTFKNTFHLYICVKSLHDNLKIRQTLGTQITHLFPWRIMHWI